MNATPFRDEDYYEFCSNGIQIKSSLNSILYFEVQLRRVKVVTVVGEYNISEKIDVIYNRLKKRDFISVNRSIFVNFANVERYSYEQLTMINKEVIKISQANRNKVRTYFLESRGKLHGDI